MKIAFCASECFPYFKTGGLADVVGSLPLALIKQNISVSIFLPKYKGSDKKKLKIQRLNNKVSHSVLCDKLDIYFIEHDHYFNRSGLYGDKKGDFVDNLDRFKYFSFKILEVMKQLSFKADVIHCHDWQTALIPVFLKERFDGDDFYKNIKTILTIHNLAFQGVFEKNEYPKLELDEKLYNENIFEFYEKVNLLKAGIHYADQVTTVSPSYAKEIQTESFGCGLDEDLKKKDLNLKGILNGLDLDIWNPKSDQYLSHHYDFNNVNKGKLKNKADLKKMLKINSKDDVPLLGYVGRLSHQKGLDLILDSLEEIKNLNVQCVIQGVGDSESIEFLKEKQRLFKDTLFVETKFNEKLAHHIYAGSDLLLMPSRFEPCGLSQMIAMRYGTLPIVYKTGGLDDTVNSGNNGFKFEDYKRSAFTEVIKEAIEILKDEEELSKMRNNAMLSDFSWEKSALQYEELYKCLLSD